VRTLHRIREKHPEEVGPWPPKRTDRPPWKRSNDALLPSAEAENIFNVVPDEVHTLRRVRSAGFDEEGNPITITQLYDSKTGDLVHQFIGLHGVLAAGLGALAVMDLLTDGHFDHIIRMCHFVATHVWRS
jgi:hypothetical protein